MLDFERELYHGSVLPSVRCFARPLYASGVRAFRLRQGLIRYVTGVTLSVYMTPAAAATTGFIFTFGSSILVRGLTSAYDTATPAMQFSFKFINALLPQFTLFDLGGRAANVGWGPVPLWVMGFLFGYLLLYASGLTALAWAKFNRRAI